VKPFRKRKVVDRSPEVAQPSKKPSIPSYSPSAFSLDRPSTSMGPPLSTSPSLSSFDSYPSTSGRNYDAEHLRMLLNASQERLRLEQELFAQERALYESKIKDLEQQKRGGGGGPSRRG
jgi:hypothetical protein